MLNSEIVSSQKKIILVTSAFHMKRAMKVSEREGIVVIAYPADFKSNKSFSSTLLNPWAGSLVLNIFMKSLVRLEKLLGELSIDLWSK